MPAAAKEKRKAAARCNAAARRTYAYLTLPQWIVSSGAWAVLTASQRGVLIVLASYSSIDAPAYPAMRTLAHLAGCDIRTARRAMRALREAKLIIPVQSPRRSRAYLIRTVNRRAVSGGTTYAKTGPSAVPRAGVDTLRTDMYQFVLRTTPEVCRRRGCGWEETAAGLAFSPARLQKLISQYGEQRVREVVEQCSRLTREGHVENPPAWIYTALKHQWKLHAPAPLVRQHIPGDVPLSAEELSFWAEASVEQYPKQAYVLKVLKAGQVPAWCAEWIKREKLAGRSPGVLNQTTDSSYPGRSVSRSRQSSSQIRVHPCSSVANLFCIRS